jgi:hypothetical protein
MNEKKIGKTSGINHYLFDELEKDLITPKYSSDRRTRGYLEANVRSFREEGENQI